MVADTVEEAPGAVVDTMAAAGIIETVTTEVATAGVGRITPMDTMGATTTEVTIAVTTTKTIGTDGTGPQHSWEA